MTKVNREINRKTVLVECLQYLQHILNICSKNYNGLEPAKGMEEQWNRARRKVEILKDLIHAYESEPVRAALADWQKEVMAQGPSALKLDNEPVILMDEVTAAAVAEERMA